MLALPPSAASLLALRPPGGFGAVLADPPIPFVTRSAKGEGRTPQHHYRCPALAEIMTLPVADIAAPDAFLFLWLPLRSPDLIKPLMESWGFAFSGTGFVWAKLNKRGKGWFMSTGYGTRKCCEVAWLGRRGRPRRLSKGVRELIVAPVREHSRKPDEIYARIEQLAPGPYVELFARQRWAGWSSWGDQLDRFTPALAGAAQGSSSPSSSSAAPCVSSPSRAQKEGPAGDGVPARPRPSDLSTSLKMI